MAISNEVKKMCDNLRGQMGLPLTRDISLRGCSSGSDRPCYPHCEAISFLKQRKGTIRQFINSPQTLKTIRSVYNKGDQFTAKEVAELLGVDYKTCYNTINKCINHLILKGEARVSPESNSVKFRTYEFLVDRLKTPVVKEEFAPRPFTPSPPPPTVVRSTRSPINQVEAQDGEVVLRLEMTDDLKLMLFTYLTKQEINNCILRMGRNVKVTNFIRKEEE